VNALTSDVFHVLKCQCSKRIWEQ